MQKIFITLCFLTICSAKNSFAQINSTFSVAAKLVGIERQLSQKDSLAQVLLNQNAFVTLNALVNPLKLGQAFSEDKPLRINPSQIRNLILRYNNAHVVLEYLVYASKNKTIYKNRLIENSRILRPFQFDMDALANSTIEADTLVQAMREIEEELAKLPVEYSMKVNGPKPPKPPKQLNATAFPAANSEEQTANNGLISTASMGIPSQSALILGAADFLAERFKTELALHYLDRMKDNIDGSELKYLFPNTRTLLNYNTIANQQQLGLLLRTSFEQDLSHLTSNFMVSLSQPDGFAKYAKTDTTLSAVIRYAQGSTRVFKEVNKGITPLEVLNNVSNEFNEPQKHDFDKIVGMVNLFASNFVVNTPSGKKWIDDSYLRNSDTLKYALALIALQNAPLFKAALPKKALNTMEDMKAIYTEYSPKMRQLLSSLKRVEQTISQHYSYTKRDTMRTTTIQYEQYIAQMSDLVQLGAILVSDKRLERSVKTYRTLSSKILEIQQATEARQYSVVLNNLVYTLDWLMPDSTKTEGYKNAISKIVLYGSFMVDVSNAKSDKQVKAILSNYALPVGSYSVKRRSEINLGLQAYVGGFAGGEYISSPQIPASEAAKGNVSFAAPIGIDVAFGTRKEGAFSAFISVVDLGAVVSFRLNDPLTRDLPELKLENVLAPGLHLFYGLPKTPISIGAGIQMAPALRSYNATNTTITTDYAIRYGITAAVDIPIFSFYNKAGKTFYERKR